ncbi:hypothetical protein QFZ94_000164 [Paraburkholderia sp. JPY465]|uniref:AvrPphF family type III effector n=1 Tax=Paraburkholderia sp. JPY465 TaxID=3042285 RepID=UPI003D2077F4
MFPALSEVNPMGCIVSKSSGSDNFDQHVSPPDAPVHQSTSQHLHISAASSPELQRLRDLGNQRADTSRPVTVGASARVRIGGKHYTSINAIPQVHRDDLLNIHDPVRTLNLTDDSVFYRASESKWVKNGRISGNPKSYAMVTNHHAVRENPRHAAMERSGYQGWTLPYEPIQMRAHELGQPILNVMFGTNAERQARGYAERPGRTMIAMTLGDFRRAGGGDVYFDVSAVVNDGVTHALVVTLPKKASVPVMTCD